MELNALLFVVELVSLAGLVLALHYASERYGLGPLLVFIGGLAGLLQLSAPLGVYLEFSPQLTFSLGSTIFVPVILLGVLVLYVTDGTASARIAIYGVIGVSLATMAAFWLIRLQLSLPGGGSFQEIPPDSMLYKADVRVIVASVIAFALDLYVILIVFQAISNRWGRSLPWLAPTLALLLSSWVDAIAFLSIASHSLNAFQEQLPGQLVGKTISAIVLSPIASFYLGRLARKLTGYAGIQSRKPFDLILGRVEQMKTALSRSETNLRRRAEELAALQSTVLELTASADSSTLLNTIVQRATPLLNGTGAGLYLTDPDRQEVRCVVSFNTPLDFTGTVLKYGEGAAGTVAQTGKPLIIDDYNTWEKRSSVFEQEKPFKSVLSAPMIWQGQVIGVLHVLNNLKTGAFTKADQELLTAFANHATIAVMNSRLLEAETRRAQEAETLRQASAAVAATLDQQEAIERILIQLDRVVPYDSASVLLLRDHDELEIVGGRGWPDPSVVVGLKFRVGDDNPNSAVIQSGVPHILHNAPEEYGEFRKEPHAHIKSWLGVPLVFQGRVIGMFAVDSIEPHHFTQEHARLVSAFADHVAIAIENSRLYESEHRRVNELAALRSVMAEISAQLDLSQLLGTILQRAVELLDATGGDLGLYNAATKELDVVASHGMGKDFVGTHMAPNEGAMGRVAGTGEPVIIEDYITWEGRSPQYENGPWHAAMAAPLFAHGDLIGVVGVVDSTPTRRFSEEDLQLLNLFAHQAAIALENARLYQYAKQAAERRAILYRASQEVVGATLDLERIYSAIHEAAAQLLPCEAFAISLSEENGQEINAVYLVDKDGRAPSRRIPANQGLSGRIISTGKPMRIDDLDTFGSFEVYHFGSPEHIRSVLAVPMRSGDKVVGMLSAQSYQPNAYNDDDLELLEMLAAHAAIAIENAHLFAEVQILAVTDGLTGLSNRRAFDRALERELSRAQRYEHNLSLIIADIDDFKLYNDTYGHVAGDERLKAFANLLARNVREPDLVARYGGEEFALLLPHTKKEEACVLAERVRRAAEASSPFLPKPGKPFSGFTLSLGIATYPQDAQGALPLLHAADNAELAAKRAGKNRVVTA